jgi:NTE family protein
VTVPSPKRPKLADLVLSGGGVKGIGLVGAVVALMDAGWDWSAYLKRFR